ncbi:potassium channel family protein [Aspergillus thermomutatus]|uniref:Potassium channel domain-containing protein n=1 Tax=Aspergillus thermomutatus TaxID=41047 RepID=A0A397HVB0_ASPTH|nr:uncharacterized protein CDV56_109512 [Aspergillus thermomutatus]RHZ67179.1 hypothetical protein CDV56_109512 [Aspergillus thermomutatus]
MMSKRDSVKGFIVTILCWCASAAILISIIGVTAQQDITVDPQQTLQYTQNFFYGTFAASLYTLVAVLLATYTRNMHSVHLTHEERQRVECTSIILRVTAFSAFLLGGAAVYATIEGWSFMDAVYWADTTLLTIGIGNIAPKTHLGRSLLFLYATAGIMTIGLVISSITSFTDNMRDLSIRIKIEEVHSGLQGRHIIGGSPGSSHNDKEKQSLQLPADPWYPHKADLLKAQRIKRDFYRRHRWMTLIFSGAAWFFLWLVSAAIFGRSERSQHWSYFQSLYFTYTSLTTIGYGDLYPTSNFGKAFFVFWSLLAVPVLTNLVGAMGQLGFEKLTYLLRYIWRLEASRLGLRRCTPGGMNPDADGEGGRNRSVAGPEPQGLVNDGNSHGRGLANARRQSNNVQASSSSYQRKECCESLAQAAERSLLLSQEISKLVSTLQSASTPQPDLSSEWERILSMLHPESDEEGDLFETTPLGFLHGHPGAVAEFLDSNRSATDRNKEILWMLKFLTDKICSHLRDGLQREQSEMSNTES